MGRVSVEERDRPHHQLIATRRKAGGSRARRSATRMRVPVDDGRFFDLPVPVDRREIADVSSGHYHEPFTWAARLRLLPC